MTDSAGEQQPARAPRKGLAERASDSRSILALFAVALYAVLRIAYVRFYSPFGIAPDDLGLGYVELLAQATIGAATLLLVIGLTVSTVVSVAVAASSGRIGRLIMPARGDWRDAAVALGVALLLSLMAAFAVFPQSVLRYPAGVVSVCLMAGAALLGTSQIRSGLAGELLFRGKPATQWWHAGVITSLFASVVLTGLVLSDEADRDAKAAMNGYAVHPELFGMRLTSWGADRGTLSWTTNKIGGTLRQLAGPCLIYLGQSGGTLFVYTKVPPGPGTFRIPATMAVVQVLPDGRCTSSGRIPTRTR